METILICFMCMAGGAMLMALVLALFNSDQCEDCPIMDEHSGGDLEIIRLTAEMVRLRRENRRLRDINASQVAQIARLEKDLDAR